MIPYLELVKADIDLQVHGMQHVVRTLPKVTQRQTNNGELAYMMSVAQEIRRVALFYRPGARCLPQAIAVARRLRRQGYPVTLVIAVRRFPFAAHAWVECNCQLLTDRQTIKDEFIPILTNKPSELLGVPDKKVER